MAGKELPEYNTSIAGMLQWPSDVQMKFPRVGMRFYPLRADLVQLQRVCDAYLNFTQDPTDDRPPYYFKPAAPFVLMQTVNYDRLEIEEIGWLTQHEAIFSIPLEWYQLENGTWSFKDWAMTYPFIYLDHPISIWMGREMYGWPKVPVRVPRLFPLRNPPDPQGRVQFNLATHSGNRANQPEPFRPFIEILQDAGGLSSLASSVSDLYGAVPRAIAGGLAGASTVVESLSNFLFQRSGNAQPAALPAMAGTGFDYISRWLPEFWTMMIPGFTAGKQHFTPSPFMRNNIVMKQFRDAHEVKSACYQALVKSEIAIDEVLDAGLLFNPLSGDASGGVTVRLHRYEAQPIIETLGLATASVAVEHGIPVTTLKPFCPFWWSLNLSYGKAETLSWRSRTTRFSSPDKQGAAAHRKNDYLVLGSGAREEIAGLETYADFTMRVLPLRADEAVLARLCDELFADTPYSFTPAAPFVLMIADQFKDMVAATNPSEQWADSELTFAIVAHCKSRTSTATRVVILPLLGFAGSEWNAISHREVDGRFMLASDFVAPHVHGMQGLPPTEYSAWRRLFTLRTSICPTLDEDEQTRRWILIDLDHDVSASEPSAHAPEPIDEWLEKLGIAAMAQNRRFEMVAHKQFRDATDASRACYQALVALDQEYTSLPEIAWIRERLQVTIHEFDSMQIAKKFGLQHGREVTDRFNRKSLAFEPIKPFWVRGAMRQGAGNNLCWRAGTMDWQPGDYSK
jgi:hypothetical protein